MKLADGSPRRTRPRQGQSDARRARPPGRRLSPARQPRGVRRHRRPADACARARRCRSTVRGATAEQAGPLDDNLVLKAARALAARSARPQARPLHARQAPAGRGGARRRLVRRRGGAAAAGAGQPARSPAACRFSKIAPKIGADVPVCLDPRPRRMRGIGEVLSAPLKMPKLAAVLVNPGVAVPTKDVFCGSGSKPGGPVRRAAPSRALPRGVEAFVEYLVRHGNDLEAPADRTSAGDRARAGRPSRYEGLPARAHVGLGRDLLRDVRVAARGERPRRAALRPQQPKWWVKATTFG